MARPESWESLQSWRLHFTSYFLAPRHIQACRYGIARHTAYICRDVGRVIQACNEFAYMLCWVFRANAYLNMPRIDALETPRLYPNAAIFASNDFENMLMSLCMITVAMRLVFLFSIVREISLVTNTIVNSLSVILPVISIVMILVFSFALSFHRIFKSSYLALRTLRRAFIRLC